MHGVDDLTWLGFVFWWLQLQKRKKSCCTCISQRATKGQVGRAGLQSDIFFSYILTFCLELSSARVYSKN